MESTRRMAQPRMDEADRLMRGFRARATSSVASKLEALIDIEQITDLRIVPFLLEVLADQREPAEVRSYVLNRLRNGGLRAEYRAPVAHAILQVLSDSSSADLRLRAVLALAEFTPVAGVLAKLGELALNRNESIDVRYSAFTSLQ